MAIVRILSFALLAIVLNRSPAKADEAPPIAMPDLPQPADADFQGENPSPDTRRVANWVATSGDNQGLPYMIIDKVMARVFLFDERAWILGSAPALLGLTQGDETVAGIGQRRLATIGPHERTTPSGRFVASLGYDFTQDILWVDYSSALSLHRVIKGSPNDRRHQRLDSASALDNRISYGCINVPAEFYDKLVKPTFTGTVGIVYVLPETKKPEEIFHMN